MTMKPLGRMLAKIMHAAPLAVAEQLIRQVGCRGLGDGQAGQAGSGGAGGALSRAVGTPLASCPSPHQPAAHLTAHHTTPCRPPPCR